jgi:hypothetical protein
MYFLYLFYVVFYLPPLLNSNLRLYNLIHTSIARFLVCVVYFHSPFLLSSPSCESRGEYSLALYDLFLRLIMCVTSFVYTLRGEGQ